MNTANERVIYLAEDRTTEPCSLLPENDVSYLEWHAISDALASAGVEQYLHDVCGLWHWPESKFNELIPEYSDTCVRVNSMAGPRQRKSVRLIR